MTETKAVRSKPAPSWEEQQQFLHLVDDLNKHEKGSPMYDAYIDMITQVGRYDLLPRDATVRFELLDREARNNLIGNAETHEYSKQSLPVARQYRQEYKRRMVERGLDDAVPGGQPDQVTNAEWKVEGEK